jgi:hypothetical protein
MVDLIRPLSESDQKENSLRPLRTQAAKGSGCVINRFSFLEENGPFTAGSFTMSFLHHLYLCPVACAAA